MNKSAEKAIQEKDELITRLANELESISRHLQEKSQESEEWRQRSYRLEQEMQEKGIKHPGAISDSAKHSRQSSSNSYAVQH